MIYVIYTQAHTHTHTHTHTLTHTLLWCLNELISSEMLLTLFCSHCIRFLSFSTDEQSFLSQKSPCPQHTKSTWATASSARQSAHDTAAPPGWQHRLPGGAEEDRSLVSGSDSAELRTMAQWAPSFKTGFAQWWSDGRAVDRLWVWVLAGVVGEVSSPGSAFCADCYFGSHSTPVLPQ